jgi:hypothetical protein
MALISPQAMAVTGTSPTFAAPTASDTIIPSDRGVYLVRTTGTATTVVLVIPGNDELGQARPDVSSTLGATDVRAFPTTAFARYVDAAGVVTITHSGALTGVTSAYITI